MPSAPSGKKGVRLGMTMWCDVDDNERREGAEGGVCDVAVPTTGLTDVWHDVVQSIVSALEARDPHTAEHSLRVGDMAERTCALMGFDAATTATVHMAAHVHDIGKIGIRDAVLLKRGRLTPDEHAVLHEHPRIGYEILRGCPSLSSVADIVLHHHERWDGSGYPDGLAGEEIPLGARVVTIADSIDAMLGKRLCRKSLTREACREEIRHNAGVMYDPRIALFVVEHWDEIVGPVEFPAYDDEPSVLCGRLHCCVPALGAHACAGSCMKSPVCEAWGWSKSAEAV